MTQAQLAEAMGVPGQRIRLLVKGRRAVTAEMAILLAEVLGTTPEFWLNLQMQVDLWSARKALAKARRTGSSNGRQTTRHVKRKGDRRPDAGRSHDPRVPRSWMTEAAGSTHATPSSATFGSVEPSSTSSRGSAPTIFIVSTLTVMTRRRSESGIARVAHRLDGPVVRVLDDAARLVGRDALALHHPLDRGLAVDDVIVGIERNVVDGDEVVVVDDALVLAAPRPCRTSSSRRGTARGRAWRGPRCARGSPIDSNRRGVLPVSGRRD